MINISFGHNKEQHVVIKERKETIIMKKIETDTHYDYSKLFDVMIDTNKLCFETVGEDEYGNYILHSSGTYNMGNAYSSSDDYFILDEKEYLEYVKKARENGMLSWIKYRRFLSYPGSEKKNAQEITSVELISLSESGMRGTRGYEILMKDGQTEITEYSIRYSNGEKQRVVEEQVLCGEQELLKLLNDCEIISWNGFHGEHPKDVLDGIMFTFEAHVNGDLIIKADGSQNFPKHYRELTNGIYEMMRTGSKG